MVNRSIGSRWILKGGREERLPAYAEMNFSKRSVGKWQVQSSVTESGQLIKVLNALLLGSQCLKKQKSRLGAPLKPPFLEQSIEHQRTLKNLTVLRSWKTPIPQRKPLWKRLVPPFIQESAGRTWKMSKNRKETIKGKYSTTGIYLEAAKKNVHEQN